jgi:hypothetical protein
MNRRLRVAAFALMAGIAAGAACGEVPTLENGIAYITTVILPSPAVAEGDTLRDSLGVLTPLRVRAFGRDSQEITGLAVRFVQTTFTTMYRIDDATGYLIAAKDTVGSVSFVGRIGDRLQTSPATLLIVPQPLSISRPSGAESGDTAVAPPVLRALPVVVTGVHRGTSTPVNGIIVRYRIDSLLPAGTAGRAKLTNAAGVTSRPDSTIAVDTTKSSGNATANVLVAAGSGVAKVFISATARRLDGPPLQGSPIRFALPITP